MNPQRGRVVAIAAAVIGLLVLLGAAVLVASRAGWMPDRLAPRRALPRSSAAGPASSQRVDIGSGSIEVSEFLRFLADFTGLPLIYDATDQRITRAKLHIAAPMKDVDVEMVRSLIESSGFSVEVETQANGKDVIRVEVKPPRGSP